MAESIFIKYYEETDCLHGYSVERTAELTRQEAIERMAKAICLERNACISKGEMCGLCVLWRNFSTYAEKALNALLEG